jgi:histidine ammonia-lyase
LQTVVLSLGAEEDASFANVAAEQLRSTAHALATVVAVELLCSSRALRLQGRRPEEFGSPRLRAVMSAGFTLAVNAEDRDLRADLDLAHQLIRAAY